MTVRKVRTRFLRILKKAGLPSDTEALIVSVGDLLMSQSVGSRGGLSGRYSFAAAFFRRSNKRRRTQPKVIEEAREFAANGKKRLSEHFPGWRVRSEVFSGTPAWVLIDAAE